MNDIALTARLAKVLGDEAYSGRQLARRQPCGCIICYCEDDDGCTGCGAKHCGTHALGKIPNPVIERFNLLPLADLIDLAMKRWIAAGGTIQVGPATRTGMANVEFHRESGTLAAIAWADTWQAAFVEAAEQAFGEGT